MKLPNWSKLHQIAVRVESSNKSTTWDHHLLRHSALDFVRTTLLCCFHALYLAKTAWNQATTEAQNNHKAATRHFDAFLLKALFSPAREVNFCIASLWDVFSLKVWDQIAAGVPRDFQKSYRMVELEVQYAQPIRTLKVKSDVMSAMHLILRKRKIHRP